MSRMLQLQRAGRLTGFVHFLQRRRDFLTSGANKLLEGRGRRPSRQTERNKKKKMKKKETEKLATPRGTAVGVTRLEKETLRLIQ